MNGEEVVTAGKWASLVSHVANNRIEYIGIMIILHLVGVSDKILEQTNGVCL